MEGSDRVIQLQKFCRVCGNRKAKSVDEFADAAFRVYDIEVEREDQNVYPKLLCSSCRKTRQSFRNKNTYTSLEAARFFEHNNECKICQPNQKPDVAVHMKICDSASLDNGGFNIFKRDSIFKRIYFRQNVKDSQLVNELEIFINKDWGYQLKVLGRNISSDNYFFCDLPRQLTNENVRKFSAKLRNIKACQGTEKFDDILEDKIDFSQPFLDQKGEMVAYVENKRGTQFDVHLGEFTTFHAKV